MYNVCPPHPLPKVGKSATSYEPLSEVDVQNIDHQIKLYVNDAIPELEVNNNACTQIHVLLNGLYEKSN